MCMDWKHLGGKRSLDRFQRDVLKKRRKRETMRKRRVDNEMHFERIVEVKSHLGRREKR